MRRTPLPATCPYFTARDPQAEDRLAVGDWRRKRRADLLQMGARPRFVAAPSNGSQGDALVRWGRAMEGVPGVGRGGGPRRDVLPAKAKLSQPTCVTLFDANSKVTTIRASARIGVPVDDLAPAVDPRGWGLSNGVIDVAFRVEVDGKGTYRPFQGDLDAPLGTPWSGGLLFEYARSDIASFENILMIDRFTVRRGQELYVEYRLVECLKTIIGFWGADGGLQRNDGFIRVTRQGRSGALIEVEKKIRVRDMTPNDAGGRYDFGQTVNATLGAALSLWVDDVSMMSPVF